MLGLCVTFTLALFGVAIFAMTETYQWLASHGHAEAKRLKPAVDDVVLDSLAQTERGQKSGIFAIFAFAHLKHLIMAFVLAATLQLTGINAVMYYGPKIIQAAGFDSPFLLTIVIGGWNFLTTVLAIFFVDRFGRRLLMLIGVGILSGSLVLIAVAYWFLEGLWLGVVVGIGLLGFILGFEVGPGCLFWVIVNEYFPKEIKESGASITNLL